MLQDNDLRSGFSARSIRFGGTSKILESKTGSIIEKPCTSTCHIPVSALVFTESGWSFSTKVSRVKSERINYGDLNIAHEILPLIRTRLEVVSKSFSPRKAVGSNRVLVVNASIIGDFLSYLPALREFTQRHNLTFDMIVSPTVKPLAEHVIGVRNLFVAKSSYDRNTERSALEVQAIPQEYDQIIVLRLSRDAFQLFKDIRCSRIISSDIVLLKYVFHLAAHSLFRMEMKQSREIMFETLKLGKVDRRAQIYDLFHFDRSDFAFLDRFPELTSSEKVVLVHTGSGWRIKLWKIEKWLELFQRISNLGKFKIVLIGATPEEQAVFERVKSNPALNVHSLIGRLNLMELFLVMKKCQFFIGVDSVPRNLAHYADLRSISILSPAAVKNFMPFNDADLVIEKSNRLPANIVNLSGKSNMEAISVDEVFEAFLKLTGTA